MPKITIPSIYEIFESKSVISSNKLMNHFECTYQCLWTYLKKVGYYSSFTHNARYYTLADIPIFDMNGIWFYDDPMAGNIGFTEHKTANNLILYLVNSSKMGMTEYDIREITKIRVYNQLKVLTGQEKIQRIQIGRKYYYFSKEPQIYKRQHNLLVQSFVTDKIETAPAPEMKQSFDQQHYEHTIKRLTASRENWRKRSNENQKKIRKMLIRVRDLEVSRDKWKQEAINYKNQVIMLSSELISVKKN